MMRTTFRPIVLRVPPVLAVSLALTLAACGGDTGQETTTIDGAAPEVASEAAAEPLPTDAVEADAVELATGDVEVPGGDGWQSLQDDWMSSVQSVQARFGELSEEELIATGGDRDQLVMLVQQKYGLAADEAEQQVSDFEATL